MRSPLADASAASPWYWSQGHCHHRNYCMAALSIDVISLYLVKEEAQRAADAAALAAARVISISGLAGDPSNSTASWQRFVAG